jgi:nucleotide-binding universal stress UspA family protein
MDVRLILHPTDGSPQAAKALDVAIDLAAQKRSKLVILHVQPVHDGGWSDAPSGASPANAEEGKVASAAMWREARKIVDQVERKAREAGLEQVEAMIVEGSPASEIVAYADQVSADMIVIGSGGRGTVEALFLGSVGQRVVTDAPCTCVVVK